MPYERNPALSSPLTQRGNPGRACRANPMDDPKTSRIDAPKTKTRLTRVALIKIGSRLRTMWEKLRSESPAPHLAAFVRRMRGPETDNKEP
jgi:hypothetical protein